MSPTQPKKRRKPASCMAMAKEALEAEGYEVGTVEQRIPHTFITRDLFGIIDQIAVGNGRILGVQVTSGSNHAARRAKALAEPRLGRWLASGGFFEIHSFSKRGSRGERKEWVRRVEEITLADAVAAARGAE